MVTKTAARTAGFQRDVTKLIRILGSAQWITMADDDVGQYAIGAAPYKAALAILTAMDGRSGRRDPHLRKGYKPKKRPVRKAGKKAKAAKRAPAK